MELLLNYYEMSIALIVKKFNRDEKKNLEIEKKILGKRLSVRRLCIFE